MKKRVSTGPLIKQDWLRVLIFTLLFFVLTGTALLLYFPEAFYTANGKSLSELMQGNRLLVFILLLLAIAFILTYIFRRFIDRKSFISLGFSLNGYFSDAAAGGMLAIFIVGASSLILKSTGLLKWTDILFDPRSLFLTLGTFLLVAVYEELIFRGYILSNLLHSLPRWPSVLISAALFMIYHWSAAGLFPFINALLMGLIMGLNYSYTRNLWFSICFHLGWKFFEGPLLGFPETGIPSAGTFQPLLQLSITGNENATGGAGGLEGSFILMTVSLLSLIALFFIFQKKLSLQSPPVPDRI